MGASLGAARGPSRRAPELVRDRFNSQAATASWGPLPTHYPPGVDLAPLYDHLTAPRGRGRELAHFASAGGAPCGDLIRIDVEVQGDRVTAAGFDASGCAAARAAGSATVELVANTPVLDAARITPQAIAEELGGLSPERMHAAHLAADALHRALGQSEPQLEPDPNRILVAMSGGVDSAVAAQRAIDEGHDVAAVTLELWADPRTDGTRSCCSPQAVVHARALAHRMGLPHVTLDVRDAFGREVVDDYVREHEAGRTPNPCVRCNGHVRFDAMLDLAAKLGASKLATGHYARITRDAHGPLLSVAADPAKDQTYMLARLRPDELERLWFPLGHLTKPEVREIARAADLPVAEKPESQDLCFLAGTDLDQFITRRDAGDIVDEAGNTLARHDGQHRFTVGQRKGIGVAGPEPLYVVGKHGNEVVVGPKRSLATTSVSVSGAMLLRDGAEVDSVKLRYRSKPAPCTVAHDPPSGRHRTLTLELEEPAHGVAPGQTACLMRGDAVIGFATIAPPRTRPAPTPTPEMELSHGR